MALAVSIYPISPTGHVGSSRKPHQYMLATTFGRTCNWRGANCKASAPPSPSLRCARRQARIGAARGRDRRQHQMLAEVHRVDTLVLSVAQFSTDAGYATEFIALIANAWIGTTVPPQLSAAVPRRRRSARTGGFMWRYNEANHASNRRRSQNEPPRNCHVRSFFLVLFINSRRPVNDRRQILPTSPCECIRCSSKPTQIPGNLKRMQAISADLAGVE